MIRFAIFDVMEAVIFLAVLYGIFRLLCSVFKVEKKIFDDVDKKGEKK